MVFFTGCVQRCVFCQNYQVNIEGSGTERTVEELASSFLELESAGCHNLHWVSPTHQLPDLLKALAIARRSGLTLPLVYNTGGYESIEVLRALEGVVDIYLPDFKYWSEEKAWKYLRVKDYPEFTRRAIAEMQRQVGQLAVSTDGIATRGLLVRHLVMPDNLEDARHIFLWLGAHVDPMVAINIMPQYIPMYRASRNEVLKRRILPEEWHKTIGLARAAGLVNILDEYGLPQTASVARLARQMTR